MYEVLFALTLIFVASAVLLLVAAHQSLPVVPFYLLAGIVVGAFLDEVQLLDLAQWGIAFLVFLFGVHVDLGSIRSTGRTSASVALLQAAVVGGLAFASGLVLGLDRLGAVYLAVAAALSSTLVAVSYLGDPEGDRATYERLAESIHFTEDVLGVLVVLGLSALVYTDDPAIQEFAVGLGLFALALAFRYGAFHRVTARVRGDEEVLMLLGVTLVAGFIALAEFAGLSIVVGAFAAGIAVADDYPHSLELVDTIDDLEDFFSPIFFVTVGALLSVPSAETIGYTLLLLVLVLVVNPALVTAALLRRGFDGRTAASTGLTLDQVSAFALFVALEAAAAGTIQRPLFEAIVLAAVVSMLAATYTTRHRERVYRHLHRWGVLDALERPRFARSPTDDGVSSHVVLVGAEYGGEELHDAVARLDRPVVAVEESPTGFDERHEDYHDVVIGDVFAEKTWTLARLEDAALLVSLTPEHDRATAVAAVETDVPRVVRVEAETDARAFLDHGVEGVLWPDALAGQRVGDDLEALLDGDRSPEEFRDRGRTWVE